MSLDPFMGAAYNKIRMHLINIFQGDENGAVEKMVFGFFGPDCNCSYCLCEY
jgi:hypothetical protein